MRSASKEDYAPFLPLSPAALQILLALASEDRHGYGIMQEVARESGGQVKLGPGTLYDNLQKLMGLGVVDEVARRSADDDPRRRYYSLSGLGRRVLAAEIERLEKSFGAAKASLRMTRPRRNS